MSETKTPDCWDTAETDGNPGYARIAQLGLSGTGKTFSAVMLAFEIREKFGLTGPIGALDTENGFDFLRPIVKDVTGQPLLVIRTRNIDTWCTAIDRAAVRGDMVLIGDSVSHLWKQLCDGYLAQLQKKARDRKWNSIPTELQFKDWNPIKQTWGLFVDRFMNAQVHQIMSGRAGWLWAMETNDRNKKELVKKDVKMRAEGEFEHEAGLSLLYERVRGNLETVAEHVVTVRKDRTDRIMGQSFRFTPKKTNPRAICEFVRPHLDALKPSDFRPVDINTTHNFGLDDMGNSSRRRDDDDRKIAVEKLKAALVKKHPGQTAKARQARSDELLVCVGTTSWTEVETRIPLTAITGAVATLEADGDELPM